MYEFHVNVFVRFFSRITFLVFVYHKDMYEKISKQFFFFVSTKWTRFNETFTFFAFILRTDGKDRYLNLWFTPRSQPSPPAAESTVINNSVINTVLFDVRQKLLILYGIIFSRIIPGKITSAFEINKSIDVHRVHCPNRWTVVYNEKKTVLSPAIMTRIHIQLLYVRRLWYILPRI